MRMRYSLSLFALLLFVGCGGLEPAPPYKQSFVFALGPNPYITATVDTTSGLKPITGLPLEQPGFQRGDIAVRNDLLVAGTSGPATLSTYRVNSQGLITRLASVQISTDTFSIGSSWIQIAPSGRFVYLLFSFLDTTTGSHGDAVGINELDPISGAIKPRSMRLLPGFAGDMKLSPDGTVLCLSQSIGYIAPLGAISCASVDRESGIISAFNNYPVDTSCCSVNFSPDGKFLAIEHAGTVQLHLVEADGTLVFPPAVQASTGTTLSTRLEFDPSGMYIAIANPNPDNDPNVFYADPHAAPLISVLQFDPQAATLTLVPGAPFHFPKGARPAQIAFAPSGKRLFAIMRAGYPDCTTLFDSFAFDPHSGALSLSQPISSVALPAEPPCYSAGTFAVSSR